MYICAYHYTMKIEYDDRKAVSNLKKHGVSFDEAASCLLDATALVREDAHSENESRWVLLGMSDRARLLVVVYTLRGESVRLISARKPTTKEVMCYG
ncbi:MAG: BrnT family toxin [Methylococcales bacterium]